MLRRRWRRRRLVVHRHVDIDRFRGRRACEDCDDINPDVNDDAVETCNGIDDNCDGATDGPDSEGQSSWYADRDGDGAGDAESTTEACDAPDGYVADSSDCDDRDASVIIPTWYADADGDSYGDASSTVEACDAPRGYVADASDCDDTDASVGSDGGSGSGSETFEYTGDVQSLTVSGCTREVTIEAYGAEGVKATTTGSTAGLGGMARGTLAVSPGDVLYIYVGGHDGYNGGGDSWTGSANTCNGGGASDVRLGGIELTDRVIVAGGGGGVSGESAWGDGGDGGGGTCDTNYCGGQRGYGYGFSAGDGGLAGGTSGSNEHGGPGGGGGYSSGGAGARATGYGGALAGSGTLGAGGDGAGSPSGCCGSFGLAGGGGGYYGGGGVAGGCCGGGGAGGGSSWTGELTSPDFEPGVQSGDGQVVISW